MDTFVADKKAAEWRYIYESYNKALSLKTGKMKKDKGKELKKLDEWYQVSLSKSIQSRKEKHITHDELCKLMKWKLSRGKFRPRLQQLVESNSDEEVISASTQAFKHLPNLPKAIESLTVLKAVGPATASAVLAAGAPEKAAFMADESMQALPGMQPLQYTLSFYKQYMDQINAIVKDLQKEDADWTPHKVEITLWTFQYLKVHDKEKLTELLSHTNKRKNEDIEKTTKSTSKKQKRESKGKD